MSQTTLFFSYTRADAEFTLKLATALREHGIDLWIDQLDIDTGERWDRAVEGALERCSGLVVILSPTSVDSTNVMDEVSYALEEGKPVFPVVYQPCQPPFRLRRLQHTDLSEDYEGGLARLVEDLRERTPRETPVSGAEAPSQVAPAARTVDSGPSAPSSRRRALIMAVAAAAVIAVAVLGYRAVSSSSGSNPPGLTGAPASAGADASVIEDIVLPTYVVLDSAFAEKQQAQRQLVDLGHAGYSNTGFFYIPAFRYLSGAELYQIFESTHLALPLTGRLMRDLGAVVRMLGDDVPHGGHHGSVGGRVARQLVGDELARHGALAVQQFAKKSRRCPLIAPRLHQDVDHVTVLVDGPPKEVLPALDLDEHLIEIPHVALASVPAPKPPSGVGSEGQAPLPGRFVRDRDPAVREKIFDVSKEPNRWYTHTAWAITSGGKRYPR